MGRGNVAKLAELRQKTDRQLLRVIRSEIESGLALAAEAAAKPSAPHARAERAYHMAARLLPTVNGNAAVERAALAGKLDRLRAALDRVPFENTRRLSACS